MVYSYYPLRALTVSTNSPAYFLLLNTASLAGFLLRSLLVAFLLPSGYILASHAAFNHFFLAFLFFSRTVGTATVTFNISLLLGSV